LDGPANVDYNSVMPRPRKDGRLLMNTDLRIPMTSEQKAIVAEATADEPGGMAAWARTVLIDAARRKIARANSTSAKRKQAGLDEED
jgi:hypothetical protein